MLQVLSLQINRDLLKTIQVHKNDINLVEEVT